MRRAQRRGAVEQRRDGLPGGALVVEAIGLRRHAETVAGFQRDAERLPGQCVERLAAVGIDIDAGEALADEVVGDDIALGIERGARVMDRSRTLRIPAGALVAHILHAHRLADGFGEHGGVHRRVVGIVAAVGARTRRPDHVDGILRHFQDGGEAGAHEMRFLRAAPAGDLAVLDLDQRAGRPHARMRLERPLVFGLDHARRRLERLVDIAGFRGLHRALARRCLADVIVERSLIGERRRRVRPNDLELLRRLDRIPLLVGDDAEEALVPDHFGGRDIFDRAFVDAHRHGAGDRGTDHAGMDHAGHFTSVQKSSCAKTFGAMSSRLIGWPTIL